MSPVTEPDAIIEEDRPIPVEPPPEPPEELVAEKRKKRMLLGIFVLIVCAFVGVGMFVYKMPAQEHVSAVVDITPKPEEINLEPPKTGSAFMSHVPNFNEVTVEDLPNFRDTRGIYSYDGHTIITSIDKIVMYNAVDKTYLSMNNPDILPCVYSTALLGSSLFVVCNNAKPTSSGQFQGKSTLAQVDLQTNQITQEYFTDDSKQRVNLWIMSDGVSLWGSSWDGVFRINPSDSSEKDYTLADIGYPGCRADHVYLNKANQVTVHITAGSDCRDGGTAMYDAATDTWTQGPDSIEAVQTINQQPQIDGKTLPHFIAVTNIIDGKRYAVTKEGAYMFTDSTMPQLKQALTPVQSDDVITFDRAQAFITRDGIHIVVVSQSEGPGVPLTYAGVLPIYLVSLTDGTIVNLSKSFTDEPTSDDRRILTAVQNSGTTFVENGETVTIKLDSTKEGIATIDPVAATVTFP